MMRKAVVGLSMLLLAAPLLAEKELDDRMMHAASILQEIRGSLDEEAPGVLADAHAVAVFPAFVKVGLLGGVRHGQGVLAARLASGGWSKPAFVRITSGSFGLQFGVSMSQLLIVFKDPKAVEAISGGQFAIGADAGYAAGKVGGSAGASTDNKLQNQIVAMARSRGLFAGVALESGVLRIEKDANVEFYNSAIGLDGRKLLEDTEVEMPPVAQHFLIVLDESVPALVPGAPQGEAGNGQELSRLTGSGSQGEAAESAPGGRVAPDGAELPSAATSGTVAGPVEGAARGNAPQAATWVTPDGGYLPPGDGAANAGQSGGSGLTGRIAAEMAAIAADKARDSAQSDPRVKGARLVADTGRKLVRRAEFAAPAPPGPGRAVISAASEGQWVAAEEYGQRMAAGPAEPAPASLPADTLAVPVAADAMPAGGSAPGTELIGPPVPSEWPEEWLRPEQLGGVCEPAS